MAKKNNPTITHTEVICFAIRAIDADMETWRQRCEGLPEDYFERATEQLRIKLEALKQMYLYETGTEYVD